MDPNRRYWHPVIGYNYRMTNLTAAIGLGPAREDRLAPPAAPRNGRLVPREPRRAWASCLAGARSPRPGTSGGFSRSWSSEMRRTATRSSRNSRRGIETRPFVYPVHALPPYREPARGQSFPVAERIARPGINLPTCASLSRTQSTVGDAYPSAWLGEDRVTPPHRRAALQGTESDSHEEDVAGHGLQRAHRLGDGQSLPSSWAGRCTASTTTCAPTSSARRATPAGTSSGCSDDCPGFTITSSTSAIAPACWTLVRRAEADAVIHTAAQPSHDLAATRPVRRLRRQRRRHAQPARGRCAVAARNRRSSTCPPTRCTATPRTGSR